ncbi:MAG: oligoendopeptidase F [Defluviitaleaceae bacterium]|nr:oligoendopeptidase F [Defluviitaleaceae bacterium]
MVISQKKRNEIDEQYKWSLTNLFETDEKWSDEYERLTVEIPKIYDFKGSLGNVDNLLKCLETTNGIEESMGRVYVYANMKLHEDGGNSKYQGFADKAESLVVRVSEATSFVEPEILDMDESFLRDLLDNDDRFVIYHHLFDNLLRMRAHVLSTEVEAILASAGDMSEAMDNVYSMLCDADMKFGIVKDENGNDVELTHGRFLSLMESPDRDVRRNAHNAMYEQYNRHKNSISTMYSHSVKKDLFYAKARRHPSCVDHSLFERNIPKEVVNNLIKTVHEYLPHLHKYLKIRREALGLSDLQPYDLYVPFVNDVNSTVEYSKAKETITTALAPLGGEYINILKDAYDRGWIDVYENAGKHSGAYSWGAFGCHPFVLMNYDNTINDMFTLAHEMGHALHSYYAWETQPYIYSGYSIFTAEVASTVNETLLIDHLMKNAVDENQKKYLTNHFIEGFRGTVFRQTMFAEFEMKTHELVENGEALTVDLLCEIYAELLKKYYGSEVVINDNIMMEWARIPHFYNPFYVFQYATGYSAAIALSQKILEKGEPAVKDYIDFLKSGGSGYSIDLLKKGGVDMSTPEPIRAALDVFKGLVDQLAE